ncbi:unnamed protein product [Caenorhabditis brenneri]
MSSRFDFALNGIYTCENFAEHFAANNFPEHHLGTVGGIDDWYLIFKLEVKQGNTFVFPTIHCDSKPKTNIRVHFDVLKDDGSSGSRTKEANLILETNMGPRGVSLNVLEVLNTKNEFLDDGALSVEYGLHLFSYEGDDGIWKFNFDDQFYNTNEMSVVKFTNHLNDYECYCSKEIVMFHCPKFAKSFMIKSQLDLTSFDDFLQIIHGVQIQYKDDHSSVLKLAQSFKVSNVLSYFDRPYVDGEITFEMAAKFKLKHVLGKKLKEMKRGKVTRRLMKLNIAKLPGETMKAFVAKVLYEKF